MNYQKLTGFFLSAILYSSAVFAQSKTLLNEPDYKRPKLFTSLPAEVPVSNNELDQIITAEPVAGKSIGLNSTKTGLPAFKGQVVSRATKYGNTLRSVVIRLDEFNGATLTLSSSTQPDGTVTYTGRIISFQHGDVYELQKKDDEYILVRKNFYDMVNE